VAVWFLVFLWRCGGAPLVTERAAPTG
jgi:hypothetical protein